jgi:hypothetical protein
LAFLCNPYTHQPGEEDAYPYAFFITDSDAGENYYNFENIFPVIQINRSGDIAQKLGFGEQDAYPYK